MDSDLTTTTGEGRGGSWSVDTVTDELTLYPPAQKDYWRKTYYDPVMAKDDGPFLHTVNNDDDHNRPQQRVV